MIMANPDLTLKTSDQVKNGNMSNNQQSVFTTFLDARTGCIESKEIKVNQIITKTDGSFVGESSPSVMPKGMAFSKGSLGGGFKYCLCSPR